MNPLAKELIKLLTDYKRLMRRHLTPQARAAKIKTLALSRYTLREDSELALYHKAQHVVEDIRAHLEAHPEGHADYCGLDAFCQHIESVINEYTITNKQQLVNRNQQAVKAMFNLIQILSLSQTRFTLEVTNKVEQAIKLVARYGNPDQHQILTHALREYHPRHPALFNALLAGFQRHKSTSMPA